MKRITACTLDRPDACSLVVTSGPNGRIEDRMTDMGEGAARYGQGGRLVNE